MMDGMDDLVQFLRNRLDEDEATARRVPLSQAPVELRALVPRAGGDLYLAIDPARVLREVEAKQQIVEQYKSICNPPHEEFGPALSRAELSRVLRLLALTYADHPDYRDDWRP